MAVFIVAEAGVNYVERLPDGTVSHRPDLGLYRKDDSRIINLIEAAARAGADAVKFQAFSADALIQRRGIDPGSNTAQLLRAAELTDRNLDLIAEEAKANGIKWFASVFDPSQIERVLSRGACALKIGNNESEWEELKGACRDAQKKTTRGSKSATEAWLRELPVWISGDADDCNVAGSWKYPANGEEPMLRSVGNQYRGYSSHFTDYRIPAAAALRGAEYIEAHLCLGLPKWCTDKLPQLELTPTDEPEADWSLPPRRFAKMVKLIREYESWL